MGLLIKKSYSYLLPVTVLGLSIGGALNQDVPSLLIMILVICIAVGLVGFGKLERRVYPILLGAIGLALLYQTTLYSLYMIGTDIHQEYYYFRLACNGWDVNIPHNYNSALGITVLAPFLSKALHIDGIWIFKVIYPAIFSLTPVILYYAFRKILDEKSAFLSSFFFVSMPVWSLEAVSISKLQLAGPLLALMVLLGVSDLGGRRKIALAILIGAGLAVVYYTINFLLLLYLSIGVVLLAVVRVLPKIKTLDKLPLEGLIVTLVVITALSLTYFGGLGIGTPLKTFAYYSYSVIGGINPAVLSPTSVSPEEYAHSDVLKTLEDIPNRNTILRAATGLDFFETTLPGKLFRILQLATSLLVLLGIMYLVKNYRKIPETYLLFVGVALLVLLLGALKPGFSSLMSMTRLYHASLYVSAPLLVIGGINPVVLSPTSVSPEEYAHSAVLKTPEDAPNRNTILRAATGLDLFETTLPGKLFRISQLATGLLILLGIIFLIKSYGKIPETYLLFVGVVLLVLLLGALKPGFSSLMGMTRLYHTSLYISAPLLVIGGIFLFKQRTGPVIACGILIPYFLLTSGFVFEITRVPDIGSPDLPYSIALSSHRIDIVGIYEWEDEAAAKYLISTFDSRYPEEKPGYTTVTKNKHIYADLPGMEFLYEFPEIGSSRAFSFPRDSVPDDSYIFLRKWNVDNQKVTYGISTGLRRSYTYEKLGMDKLLGGRLLLYDRGAQIYGPKR